MRIIFYILAAAAVGQLLVMAGCAYAAALMVGVNKVLVDTAFTAAMGALLSGAGAALAARLVEDD